MPMDTVRRKDFKPDSRCIGGARVIREEWRNMSKKIRTATSQVQTRFHDPSSFSGCASRKPQLTEINRNQTTGQPQTSRSRPSAVVNHAARLSQHRALRRAAVGTPQTAHMNRVYHMHRRINEQAAPMERRKDPWIAGFVPPPAAAPNRSKMLVDSDSPWLPMDTTRMRPKTAAGRLQFDHPQTLNLRRSTRAAAAAFASTAPYRPGLHTLGDPFEQQCNRMHASHATCGSGPAGGCGSNTSKHTNRKRAQQPSTATMPRNQHVVLRRAFKEDLMDEIIRKHAYDDHSMHAIFDKWLKSHQAIQRPSLLEAIDLVCQALNAPV